MAEKTSHKRAKTKGLKEPKTEVPISRGRRLDAKDNERAREVERSGDPKKIKKAIQRLNTQKNKKKELIVPNTDLDKAKEIAKEESKGTLTIQNLSKTKRRYVKK